MRDIKWEEGKGYFGDTFIRGSVGLICLFEIYYAYDSKYKEQYQMLLHIGTKPKIFRCKDVEACKLKAKSLLTLIIKEFT